MATSDKILSQQEIEALMSALAVEQDAPALAGADAPQGSRSVKVYDFRRPDKFSKEHVRALRILHETFGRSLASALTSYLRTSLQLRLTMVEQVTYEEYIRSLPSPTVVYVVNLPPLVGQAIVEVNLDVARTLMDRLLGGSGVLRGRPREMTEIEMALLRTLGGFISRSLQETWRSIIPVEPSVQEPVLSPEFVQITLAGETTIMLVLEVALLKTTGTMSICLPHPMLQPIMDRLTAQVWSVGAYTPTAEKGLLSVHDQLRHVALPVSVELGKAEMTLRSLLNLAEGDIIKLDTAANDALPVRIGGRPKFGGRPGIIGKNLAVQITHILG